MIEELLTEVVNLKISLAAKGELLDIYDPNNKLTSDLLGRIKEYKGELLKLLSGIDAQTKVTHIPISEPKDHYRLSSAQQRLYFLYELDRTSVAYNLPYVVSLEGVVDIVRLEDAFRQLIDRHEILRTRFVVVDEEVVQVVGEDAGLAIERLSCKWNEVDDVIKKFIRPFDLSTSPLIRIGIAELSEKQHVLMLDMHHIIADGSSQGILVEEFMSAYEGRLQGEPVYQYKDYSEWQYGEAYRKSVRAERSFWVDQFMEPPLALDLPTDFTRPPVKSHEGSTKSYVFTQAEVSLLETVGGQEGATLFMTLLAAVNILLGRLSNQDDIVVGTPTGGRPHSDLEPVVGMFANTLALRNQIDWNRSFRDHLREVKSNTLQCFDNQGYQYEELIGELKIERDAGRNPLFDVMLVLQNYEQLELTIPGLKLKPYRFGHSSSKFDLALNAEQHAGGLTVQVEYSTKLFKEETIDRMMGYLRTILGEVSRNADQSVGKIDIVSGDERKWLMDLNATGCAYDNEDTLVGVFERQVKKKGNGVALYSGDRQVSYDELDELSDRVCGHLQETIGVKQGDLVGVMMDRGVELVASIFGILKSGAAYVPFDMRYPAQRVKSMREDSKVKTVITRGSYEEMLTGTPTKRKRVTIKGSDAAYVIYTSGSTGEAKGVMVEHHSVINRIGSMQKQYPLGRQDVILQKTPVSFDVSVWELFWWTFTGSSVALLPVGGEKDPETLISSIDRYGVTTLHFVPSMLGVFLSHVADQQEDVYEKLKSVRQVFSSGEALKADHVISFRDTLHRHNPSRLINLYGPTEATVDVSYYECRFDEEVVPIGRPIDNTELYVMNRFHRLAGVNCAGELYIGGGCLARGYLNNIELTGDKFIAHPFKPGERLYRSGDVAKVSPSGDIIYLGRHDEQVKIRGFRIEPAEIERHLLENASISACVVVAAERGEDRILVAYYVSKEEQDEEKLRARLLEKVPEYKIGRAH